MSRLSLEYFCETLVKTYGSDSSEKEMDPNVPSLNDMLWPMKRYLLFEVDPKQPIVLWEFCLQVTPLVSERILNCLHKKTWQVISHMKDPNKN